MCLNFIIFLQRLCLAFLLSYSKKKNVKQSLNCCGLFPSKIKHWLYILWSYFAVYVFPTQLTELEYSGEPKNWILFSKQKFYTKSFILNLQTVFVMRCWQEKYLPVYSYTTENQFTTGLMFVSYSVCMKTKLAIERGFMFHYVKKKGLPTNALQSLTVTTILYFCAVLTSKLHKKVS